MKIIIPYREKSERCHNKNTREFFAGKSLLETTVDHLANHEIWLACIKSETAIQRAKCLGVAQLHLPESTATGSWSELAVTIAELVGKSSEPIGFAFCTNPVFFRFNRISEFISKAQDNLKEGFDSAVVYSLKHYILDQDMRGVNHGQGPWHQYSQFLPQWNINPWLLYVTTTTRVCKNHYWFSPKTVPLPASGPCVDIDTEEDFQLAQTLFKYVPTLQ